MDNIVTVPQTSSIAVAQFFVAGLLVAATFSAWAKH